MDCAPTFELVPGHAPRTAKGDGAIIGIRCLLCGRTSWNPNDVDELYCGHCHRFHDDPIPQSATERPQ